MRSSSVYSVIKLALCGQTTFFLLYSDLSCPNIKENKAVWPHETILKLEDSRFNMCTMAEETREFETDGFVHSYHVYWTPVANWRTTGL